mgnify:CR=1 FL=1
MSMLTESEYEEYMQLLKAWVQADKALEGLVTPDAEAQERARTTRAAVQGFRSRYGLGEAAVGAAERR